MFGPLGFWEILFILALALLIFGPKKLPEIGRTLGRSLGEFRRATTDLKRSIETEIDADERAAKRSTSTPQLPEKNDSGETPSSGASPDVTGPSVTGPSVTGPGVTGQGVGSQNG